MLPMKKIFVACLSFMLLLSSCNTSSESHEASTDSIESFDLDSTDVIDSSSTSITPEEGPLSEEEWHAQITELGCLEGNYEISRSFPVIEWR